MYNLYFKIKNSKGVLNFKIKTIEISDNKKWYLSTKEKDFQQKNSAEFKIKTYKAKDLMEFRIKTSKLKITNKTNLN